MHYTIYIYIYIYIERERQREGERCLSASPSPSPGRQVNRSYVEDHYRADECSAWRSSTRVDRHAKGDPPEMWLQRVLV